KAGIDYLFVTSQPPPQAARGQEYVYPIVVKSKKGGVQFALDAGPQGLKITEAGVVRWKVPADLPDGSHDVIVTVRDKTGQGSLHTCRFTGAEKASAPPAVPVPPGPPAKEAPPEKTAKEPAPQPAPAPQTGIRPAPLQEDRETRPLPGIVSAVCVG